MAKQKSVRIGVSELLHASSVYNCRYPCGDVPCSRGSEQIQKFLPLDRYPENSDIPKIQMNDWNAKAIEVRLFAGIREALGTESIRIAHEDWGDVKSAVALKETIVRLHPELRLLIHASRIAVGNVFVDDEDRLESAVETGKTIALIPPVSGG